MRRASWLSVLSLAIALLATEAGARGFWLNATYFHLDSSTRETAFYFGYGHVFPVHEPVDAASIASLRVYPAGGADAVEKLEPGPGLLAYTTYRPASEGAMVVVSERVPQYFTVYERDGQRATVSGPKTGLDNVSFSALISGFAKLLLDKGEAAGNRHTEPVGLDFELVPETAPAALTAGPDTELVVRLLINNPYRDGGPEPAANVLVLAWTASHMPRDTYAQRLRSDQDGLVRLKLDTPGPWLLVAEKSFPAEGAQAEEVNELEFSTSLSFEVR